MLSAGPGEIVTVSPPDDPFPVLEDLLQGEKHYHTGEPGWVGLMTYEAGRAVEHVPDEVEEPETPPRLHFARYRSALWWGSESARFSGRPEETRLLEEALFDPLSFAEEENLVGEPVGEPSLDMDEEEYLRAFAVIAAAISRGDVYQVNLTTSVRGRWRGSPLAFHERLTGDAPPPWSAYLDLGDTVVSSASPELLLYYTADRRLATSAPIKGTIARSDHSGEDERRIKALAKSPKDRAEHIMIVDLVRNDLGRVCSAGTIEASPLMGPLKLSRIHHLVTEVRGALAPGVTVSELLRALYPGGSITGAPKVAAMTFIDALEKSARGVYCGALGRLSPNGDVALALPIRTATLRARSKGSWNVSYGAGGGLVADSKPDEEYRELLLKAGRVMEVLSGA